MANAKDQLIIEGKRVIHNLLFGGPGGHVEPQRDLTVAEFINRICHRTSPVGGRPLGPAPPGLIVRDVVFRNNLYVVLAEIAPGPRAMQWLASDSPVKYGPGATYQDVTISLPWQYFFVAITTEGFVQGLNSLYFLDHQLDNLNERLLEPHLYNCSVKSYHVWCWICSQGFLVAPVHGMSLLGIVNRCIDQFWFSGFNESSERHEPWAGGSFFSKNRTAIRDARVQTVKAWETATAKASDFALSVPWIPAPRTPRQVYAELFAANGSEVWAPRTASDLADILGEQDKGES